jgi:hypothetical protein
MSEKNLKAVSCHDYETIKALAAERGCRIDDLLVLAAKNDPFYCHLPRRHTAAQWFAGLWESLDLGSGPKVHVRRLHYRLVSQNVRTADTTSTPIRTGMTSSRRSAMPGSSTLSPRTTSLIAATTSR